ncbi:Uncharacterised protein [Mycobacteroides abscessus subsp. abscessus]|nr:Uncharacterised protein [Mycobacteroides abscessus subsp. abscessus]
MLRVYSRSFALSGSSPSTFFVTEKVWCAKASATAPKRITFVTGETFLPGTLNFTVLENFPTMSEARLAPSTRVGNSTIADWFAGISGKVTVSFWGVHSTVDAAPKAPFEVSLLRRLPSGVVGSMTTKVCVLT